jgi:hypothetical protein
LKAYYIFEKFEEESDPIQDMGIGMKVLVQEWINKIFKNGNFKEFDLKSMTRVGGYLSSSDKIIINPDRSINFNGVWVDLSCYYDPIPKYIKIKRVNGDFSCSSSNFPLRKLPKIVTHQLKYFIPWQKQNKISNEDILKYCKAKIVKIEIDS